jgi:hypothetical protein
LLDVEHRIEFPAREDVEFPASARERRLHEPVVDLLRYGPLIWRELREALLEVGEVFAVACDVRRGPVARSGCVFHPRNIVK